MPLLKSKIEVEALVAEARKSGFVAFDTETTGLDWTTDRCIGASFCFDGVTGYYVQSALLPCLAPMLGDPKVFKCAHNAKFDLHFLRVAGITVRGTVYDTEVLARVENENRPNFKLKDIGAELFPADGAKDEQDALKKWMADNGVESFAAVPVEILAPYACKDAVLCFRVFKELRSRINDQDAGFEYPEGPTGILDLWSLVEREAQITRIAERMEQVGSAVDVKFLAEYRVQMQTEMARLVAEIRAQAGIPDLNPESDDQLATAMLKFGWLPKEKTPTGKPKVDKYAVEDWEHPFGKLIREYRRVSKLAGTYCTGIIDRARGIVGDVGELHPDFRTNGAVTGRFSCTNPNMQNQDKKSEARKAFIVRPGFTNFYLDFKQIEICIFAYYANDKLMQDALWEGADFHKLNATAMYDIPLEAVTADQREKAKTFNFALLYGAGERKVAKMLGVELPEAGLYKKRYMDKFPSVRKMRWKTENCIRERGFVVNRFGRRRRLRGEECYKAMNALIQSCAADLLKEGLVRVATALEPYGDKAAILLQIHDELVLQVADCPEQAEIVAVAVKAMSSVGDMVPTVPIRVDVECSKTNWLDKDDYHADPNLPAVHGGGLGPAAGAVPTVPGTPS